MTATVHDNSTRPAFEYQSALRVPCGKLATLLILAIGSMFFATLIGACVGLRLGAPDGLWPSPREVHVNQWLGALNTLLLVCSSITILIAINAVKRNDTIGAKRWLLLTVLLGAGFLGAKGYEFASASSHGIQPGYPRRVLFDRADPVWLSALKEKVRSEIGDLEQDKSSADNEEKLQRLLLIQSGMVKWNESKVGRTGDTHIQRMALESLASQINPTCFSAQRLEQLQEYTKEERLANGAELSATETTLAELNSQLKETQKQIKDLKATGSESSAELAAQIKRAADATTEITRLTTTLAPLQARNKACDEIGLTSAIYQDNGINQLYQLKLPMVTPGGNSWAGSNLMLVGSHTIYAFFALAALLALVAVDVKSAKVGLLENVALYWHFVVIVWIFLLPMLYLF